MRRFLAACLLAVPLLAFAQEPLPTPDELLKVVFPTWRDEHGARTQAIAANSLNLHWRGDAPATRVAKGAKRQVEIAPLQVLRVAPERLLLLATMLPAGDALVRRDTPLGLAAYTFKPGKSGWQVAKRQEPFALHGTDGRAQLDVVPISATARALFVGYGGCWQGRCNEFVALYALGADGVAVTPLLQQPLHGDNVQARADCAQRLSALLPELAPPLRTQAAQAPARCEMIDGVWRVDAEGATPGALTMRFAGAVSKDAAARPERVSQEMVFNFRNGQYVPVSGANPVPVY